MGGGSYIVFCHVILNCIVYIINTQYFCIGFNNFKRKFSSFEFSADVGPPWSTREKKKFWGFLYWCLCLLGLHINSGNLSCGFLDQSKFIASAVASHLIQTFVCAFLKWEILGFLFGQICICFFRILHLKDCIHEANDLI